MLKGFHLLIFISLFHLKMISQINFSQNNEIIVIENGNNILNPWSGGLNFCQFSEIDLNLDGEKDIFIFDRSGKNGSKNGNKIIPMLFDSNLNEYIFAPEYISNFPLDLEDWVLLIDYNQDGKEDLFTSVNNAIALFTNVSSENLEFEFTKILTSDVGFGPTNLYVSSVDLPAIIDVDGDCDIDILSFNPEGTHVYFHQNKSMELYSSCNTIDLYRTDNCWGKFQENFTDNDLTLLLDENCQIPEEEPMRIHAGSTLLALDLNPSQTEPTNNTMELLIGDISYSNIVMVLNGGTPENALMVDQDQDFPNYNTPANLPLFPACFYLDINKDGLKDIIISPNGVNISENSKNCLYYKNLGGSEEFWIQNEENMFEFDFIQNDLFVNQMIDVGSNSIPILYDLNNDGLLDLIIGNKGYYNEANYDSKLKLYKNIGTELEPKFSYIMDDFGGLSLVGNLVSVENIHPTFGDIDNDGDIDIVFGDSSGKIFIMLAINTETGIQSEFPLYSPDGNILDTGIDVGSYSTPQLIDLNRDGLLDLVVGERSGIDNGIYNGINYFKNTGEFCGEVPCFTDETPELTLDGTSIKSLGGINLMNPTFLTAYTTPHVFEYEGKYHLAIGTESGKVFLYNNIEDDLLGFYNFYTNNILPEINCVHSSVTIHDINNDEKPDLIRGNASGGLEFFLGNEFNLQIHEDSQVFNLEFYPNPSAGIFNIKHNLNHAINIEIFSITGKLLVSKSSNQKNIRIDFQNKAPGVYIAQIKSGDQIIKSEKIIINK